MKVDVRVIPNSKKSTIKEEAEGLKVYVTAPAVDGKANKAIVPLLAKHYSVRKSQIEIVKGLKTRNKLINYRTVAKVHRKTKD